MAAHSQEMQNREERYTPLGDMNLPQPIATVILGQRTVGKSVEQLQVGQQ